MLQSSPKMAELQCFTGHYDPAVRFVKANLLHFAMNSQQQRVQAPTAKHNQLELMTFVKFVMATRVIAQSDNESDHARSEMMLHLQQAWSLMMDMTERLTEVAFLLSPSKASIVNEGTDAGESVLAYQGSP